MIDSLVSAKLAEPGAMGIVQPGWAVEKILRRLFGVCAAGLALLAQPCIAGVALPDNPQTAYEQLVADYQARHCDQALDLLAAPSAVHLFDASPDAARLAVDQIGAICAMVTRQGELALKFATAGTAFRNAPGILWGRRLGFEWSSGDHVRTIASIETMAATSPEALNGMDVDWLDYLNRTLKSNGEEVLRRRLVKVLASPDYTPADIGRSIDGYRYQYAAMQVEAGDKTGAAATFALIETPGSLIHATLDPRLRALVPAGFDARAVVDRHIERMRDIAAAHPDLMAPMLNLASAYDNLDEGREMLASLELVRPGKDHPGIKATRGDVLNWVRLKAEAYTLLGRYADALATLRQSMAPGEVNANNPMELTNIAALHLRFGHAADALAALAPLDKTPDGLDAMRETYLRKLRGCASFMAGKSEQSNADLAYLRAHDSDGPGNLYALLLCMHRDDAAAALLIKDLGTPDLTAGKLVQLSSFAPCPPTYPRDWYRDGVARMAARADVQAAVAQAGGAGHFDIPPF